MMVPPFEEAAFTQEVGVHSSAPIESQFGFHIILVETRRDSEPLDFETQRPQLIRAAESDIIQAIRSEATDAAEITLSANPFTEAEGEASEAEDSSAD
jgi:peptidyl-prolyl cis-trans isomerase C